MIRNLNKTGGLIFSQNLFGRSCWQRCVCARMPTSGFSAMPWPAGWKGADFKTNVEADPDIEKYLTKEEIEACFEPKHMLKHIDDIYARYGM